MAGTAVLNYWPHIVVLFLGAWLGTFLGTKILKRFSDERFKVMLKWVLTLLALRLIVVNTYALV